MKLDRAVALVTGGAGGIGSAVAAELLANGARVLLADRDRAALNSVRATLGSAGDRIETIVADLTDARDRERVCERARSWGSGINTLVNNAGLNHFGLFEEQPQQQIDAALMVNVHAPLHLCHDLLPHLRQQPRACIINTGSVFGAIGYPGYVTYSATKFALRGFTEALRRELASTRVSVHYIAPRATRTSINSGLVERMNAELGVAMDPPQRVARAVVRILASGQSSATVGWPEKFFVRINALFPGLVDRAIREQLPVIERYASTRSRSHAI